MKTVTTNKQIRIIRILITAAVLFAAVLILPAAADPAQYTLTYDANGQTVTVPQSVTAADGSVIFILAPELTDTGTKQFNGWNNKTDGTGKYYYPGGKFTIKSNITLYAQWINKTVNFSVVVKENNVWTASPAKKYSKGDVVEAALQITSTEERTFDAFVLTLPENTTQASYAITSSVFSDKPYIINGKNVSWYKSSPATVNPETPQEIITFTITITDNITSGLSVTAKVNQLGKNDINYLFNAENTTTLQPRTPIEKPTPNTGLIYNGEEQTGVAENANYTITGTSKAVLPDTYTANVTPNEDYCWADTGLRNEISLQWTIGKKEVNVTGITAKDKTYDGTPAAELLYPSLSDIISGDEVNVTAVGAFADKNVSTGKTVTLTNISLTGTNASRYYINQTGIQTETSANITARSVNVTGITAENKVYDGTTAATLNFTAVSINTKVEGDDLTVTADGAFTDAAVGTGKTVTISNLTLRGTDAGNYNLDTDQSQTQTSADITSPLPQITKNTGSAGDGYDNTFSAITAAEIDYTYGTKPYEISLTSPTFKRSVVNVSTVKYVDLTFDTIGRNPGKAVVQITETADDWTNVKEENVSITDGKVTISAETLQTGNYTNAKQIRIIFKGYTLGDVTLNHKIDASDAVAVGKYTVDLESFTSEQMFYADVGGDDAVTIYDAANIAKYEAKKVNEYYLDMV